MLAVVWDLLRYWPLVRVIAICNFLLGGLLLAIDIAAGMPIWWTLCEGPPILAAACLMFWAHHKASATAGLR